LFYMTRKPRALATRERERRRRYSKATIFERDEKKTFSPKRSSPL